MNERRIRMQTRTNFILALLIIAISGCAWEVKTEPFLTWQPSLSGIDTLHVVVEPLTADAKKNGLTKRRLQTDVELKLRREGIMVIPMKESVGLPEKPCLYINIKTNTIKKEPMQIIAYSVSIRFMQTAIVLKVRVHTITWFKESPLNSSGLAPSYLMYVLWAIGGDFTNYHEKEFVKGVREVISDELDYFINDYLAANPDMVRKRH